MKNSSDISSGVEVTRTLGSYFHKLGYQTVPIVSKAVSKRKEIGTADETIELVNDKVISQVSALIQSLAISKKKITKDNQKQAEK